MIEPAQRHDSMAEPNETYRVISFCLCLSSLVTRRRESTEEDEGKGEESRS